MHCADTGGPRKEVACVEKDEVYVYYRSRQTDFCDRQNSYNTRPILLCCTLTESQNEWAFLAMLFNHITFK